MSPRAETARLTVLVLASDQDEQVVEILADIAQHDLLRRFVVVRADGQCELIDRGIRARSEDFWTLVAEFRLKGVKLLRVSCGGQALSESEFTKMNDLRLGFISDRIPVVIGTLVAPLATGRVSAGAFRPFWDINAILEPRDSAGEEGFPSVDLSQADRQAALCAAAVGLLGDLWCWLPDGSLDDVNAVAQGTEQRIRLIRVVTRLVDAGDLTARAVSWALKPGSQLPPPPDCVRHGSTEQAVDGLLDFLSPMSGSSPLGFSYVARVPPTAVTGTKKGVMETIRLFVREVVNEIRKMPAAAIESGVAQVIARIEESVTKKTFGEDSSIIVTLREPKTLSLATSSEDRIAQVRQFAEMGPLPVKPSAQTWEQFVKVVLAAADGNDMPEGLDGAQPRWSGDRAVVSDVDALAPAHLSQETDPGFVLEPADLRTLSWNDQEPLVLQPTDVIAINAVRSLLVDRGPVSPPLPDAAPLNGNPGAVDETASSVDPPSAFGSPPPPPPPSATDDNTVATPPSTPRETLVKRLDAWSRPSEDSLVYRLAQRILHHQTRALSDVGQLDEQLTRLLADLKRGLEESTKGRRKFVRRVLLTILILVVLLALTVVGFLIVSLVAGIVLAVVFAGALVGGLGSIYSRGAKRVRDKFKLDALADWPTQLQLNRQHTAEEYARLNGAYDVYHDWARVIASAVHRPWGTVDAQAITPWVTSTGALSFISGEPAISREEMARTSLGLAQAVARRGWLSSTVRERREHLVDAYRRMTGGVAGTEKDPELDYTGPELLTALDTSDSLGAVEVYAPRTHFRRSYVSGEFADDYRAEQISGLRTRVESDDPSAMIKSVSCNIKDVSGQSADRFLSPIVEIPLLSTFRGMVADHVLGLGTVNIGTWCGISRAIADVSIPETRHRVEILPIEDRLVLASFRLDVTDPLTAGDLTIVDDLSSTTAEPLASAPQLPSRG